MAEKSNDIAASTPAASAPVSAESLANSELVQKVQGLKFYSVKVEGGSTFLIPTRYHNLKVIGTGGQGVVCSAFDSFTNQRVAIKKLSSPFQHKITAQRAYREIKLLSLVHHTNVIRLVDVFSPQHSPQELQDIYIVMELMDFNLAFVLAQKNNVDHSRMSFFVYQMLCALKYLHSAGIIHRDLKPANIGVMKRTCNVKIFDFGTARFVGPNMTEYIVTRYYRAPEVVLEMGYNEKVDVWSIGCIMGEMIQGSFLFPGEGQLDQWNKIVEKVGTPSQDFIEKIQYRYTKLYVESRPRYERKAFERLFPDIRFPRVNSQYPTLTAGNARDLLSKLLVIDPEHRISVDEALQHPYISLWDKQSETTKPEINSDEHALVGLEQERTVEQWKELIYAEMVQHHKTLSCDA